MKVLVVEPCKKPYVKEIEDDLNAMQNIVGGLIEPVYIDDNAIIVNEEGKINGLPFNRALYYDGKVIDYLFGTFFICGLGEENFADLDDSSIERFSKLYAPSEYLINYNGKIIHTRI